jgi:hypothetical protein
MERAVLDEILVTVSDGSLCDEDSCDRLRLVLVLRSIREEKRKTESGCASRRSFWAAAQSNNDNNKSIQSAVCLG